MSAPPELEQSGPVFDRARRLARALFGDDIDNAGIILVGRSASWRSHDPERRLPHDVPGARWVVEHDELLWVEDASRHPVFDGFPAVTGPPHMRLYVAAPIRLEDGSIPGVLAVGGPKPRAFDRRLASRLQDLADFVADEWIRVRATQAREVSARERDVANATLAAFIEAAPLSLALTDREMRLMAVSPVWLQDRALSREKVLGRTVFDVAPDVFEAWRPELERCLRGATAQGEKVSVPRPGGGDMWMQARVAPWRDAAGEVGGLILIAHNVTQIVEALDRTARSEERLKLAVEIAKLHVWELDFVNQELSKVGAEDSFFEVPQTYEGLAQDIWASIDRRDLPAVIEAWRQYETQGRPFIAEYRIGRSDGREVWATSAAKLIRDAKGEPLRLVGALQNVTRRKTQEQALIQAKEEAEAANLAKSAFLATISHEIRTPLNGVLGMAQAMAQDELDPVQRERLEVVRHSGEGLLAILNDVLDLSKIEAGKLTLEEGEFDVSDLARGAYATFQAVAENKGLEFELKVLPAAHGVYRGDPMRVRQILYNLISNALKFTEVGSVKVAVGRRGEQLQIKVADTGIGISPEQQDSLFHAFEQADASTTRRYGGTGLGLAICRDLTELMRGRVSLKSALGEGTVFTVSLPLPKLDDGTAQEAAERDEAAPDRAVAERPIRVLAAEDNSVNQLVLKTLLNQAGIEPVLVFDGRAAVDAWARESWDLILMDVQMPVMDGPAAAAEIRAREKAEGRPRTPIVALTANAMHHQVAKYLAAGMDGFVAKPIEAGRLFAVLEAALAGAAQPGGAEAAA